VKKVQENDVDGVDGGIPKKWHASKEFSYQGDIAALTACNASGTMNFVGA